MTALQEPFRYDYVGSFLRPEKVKKAKALYEDGKIEKEELDETINEAIREVVAKQMVSSVELTGIWILCGDLRELRMN